MRTDPYAEFQQPASDPYAEFQKPATDATPPAKPAAKPAYFTPENFQNLASEAGEREQAYQYIATGAEKDPRGALARAGAGVMSGVEGIVRVTDQITAGLLDPKTAVAFLVSKFSPAAAGAYFMTQSSVGATDAGRDIAKNGWTPENTERLMLSLAGIAGGATMTESAPKTTLKAGELLKKLKEKVHGVTRNLTEARQGVREAVVNEGDKYANELSKNQEDRREAVQENIDKDTNAKADIERSERETAEKNREIEAKNQASRDAVARKAELSKKVDKQSAALGKTIEQVEAKVYKAADEKYNTVREKLGITKDNPGPTVPPDRLINTVRNVQTEVLRDIPEDVEEFRAILKMAPDEEGAAPAVAPTATFQGEPISATNYPTFEGTGRPEAQPPEPAEIAEGKPLTWDKLQSLKSRIDARLRSRGRINGDLKRGLFQVRDVIVEEMGGIAERNGAAEEWTDARNFWRQMREDFHDSTGPSGSGSPVAQALDAVDPRNIRQPFLRTQSGVGNRGIDILRKYPAYGGTEAATQAEQLILDYNEMTGLPDTVKETPTVKAPKHKIFGFKEVPEQPAPPTVNTEQVSRQKIQETAQRIGRLNAWDARIVASSAFAGILAPVLGFERGVEVGVGLVVTKYLLGRALEKPALVEWIARTPPAELAALSKLPQAQLVNVKSAITATAELTKAKYISPQLGAFLGPENVKRILAASGAVAGSQTRKSAGQQKKDIHAIRSSNPSQPIGEER